jgi:mannosyltransferase
MIVFDGIVYSIQLYGGISNYFSNLLNNFTNIENIDTKMMLYGKPKLSSAVSVELIHKKYRTLERYRSVIEIPDKAILHSSYYRVSKSKNVKNVISLYDFTYEKFNNRFRSVPHIEQKKRALQRADAILCISENTKTDLLYYYPTINPSKIFVTYLASSDEFYPMDFTFTQRISIPFVLFVGSRRGYKNFKTVVAGLSLVGNIKLFIIGGGALTKVENTLLISKLPKRFTHFGYINNTQLNKLYNQAICLIYPSLYEGFGIPILEAMQANCPVICNNKSSIPEVAGDGAILLDDCTPESISYSVKTLFVEETFLFYQKKGIQNSLRFSWKKTSKQTFEIYELLSQL